MDTVDTVDHLKRDLIIHQDHNIIIFLKKISTLVANISWHFYFMSVSKKKE